MYTRLIVILILFLYSCSEQKYQQQQEQSTYQLLGNPSAQKYPDGELIYARNIWDMQYFDNKIYLGAGNSSNAGPAQNAGRVPLYYWDLELKKFVYEYKVAEEQIDLFKVFKNTLYIPGHDATQKWTFGNIYSKKIDENWKKHRTLPKALHVYDLIVYDGKLFTAVGKKGKGSVFVSEDNAKSWKSYPIGSGRIYSLFLLNNNLFAARTFKPKKQNKISITQWQENYGFSARPDLTINNMFPYTSLKGGSIKLIKPVTHNNALYYLGAYKHNDHQSKPFALFKAQDNNNQFKIEKIKLPRNSIPRDIIHRDEAIYVLVNSTENNISQVSVLKINDIAISNILTFDYPTFARSFEKVNNCFYFGMGSDLKSSSKWGQNELKPQTGDILKSCLN